MPLSIIISFYKASVSHTINPIAIADISPNSLAVHHNLLWLNLETEAVHRMIAMEIIPHNIMDFIESDTVYVSRDYGILYKLENEEKVIVKKLKKNTICLSIMRLIVLVMATECSHCFLFLQIPKIGEKTEYNLC